MPRCKAPLWRPGPPWVGSRSPDGWDQIPRWAGGRVLHQPPWTGVLGSIPKREELGKTGAPCVQVPGSSHRPRLVASCSTCPPLSSPLPREQLCNRYCSNEHTHRHGAQYRDSNFKSLSLSTCLEFYVHVTDQPQAQHVEGCDCIEVTVAA